MADRCNATSRATRVLYSVFFLFFFYITISMKQCFTTQNKKFNCDYCITNAGDREFDISNGSSFQLGHTALAGDQIDGCFKLP